MKSFLIASLVLSAVATPAFAQDSAAPATTPAADTTYATTSSDGTSGSTFRGFRIEGNAGGDRFQSQGVHRDKFGYGATIGFDGQIGDRIVIGPEATYWRSNKFSENCTGVAANGTLCNKSFEEFGVGVRAGVLVAPQLLVFGKGGYVTNEQRKRFSSATGATVGYEHYNTDGYQVGGGVELSMADRFQGALSGVYVNAQYVYSQYNNHTSRQRVMGGVGIRFR
jgi:outer membrane immunogenic protein